MRFETAWVSPTPPRVPRPDRVAPMEEAAEKSGVGVYRFQVQRCSGNTGYEVRQWTVFPGAFYCEQIGEREWSAQKQRPTYGVWLTVGYAREDVREA